MGALRRMLDSHREYLKFFDVSLFAAINSTPICFSMRKGYLALVLHAHLPFVRHPEYPEFLEEDWLFEAITETYVPLWQVFEGLYRDGVPFRLTMSLTPTLCAMLNDELLRERYLRYLERAITLSKREIALRGSIIAVFWNAARSTSIV